MAKEITKLTVEDIPTAKNGDFNKFLNSLTSLTPKRKDVFLIAKKRKY